MQKYAEKRCMRRLAVFPMEKKQAVSFNLIDHLHQNASIIITTNKSPDEWLNIPEDEVLAIALLNRLLLKCEVVNIPGKSFRIDNRETIFLNLVLFIFVLKIGN
jgi:DNA replication protein DnaC